MKERLPGKCVTQGCKVHANTHLRGIARLPSVSMEPILRHQKQRKNESKKTCVVIRSPLVSLPFPERIVAQESVVMK